MNFALGIIPERLRTLRTFCAGRVCALAMTFGFYAIAAVISLRIPFPVGTATPIWFPAGVSFVAVMLAGPQAAIAVFAADFATSIWHHYQLFPSFIQAVGNTLECLIASYILVRFAVCGRIGKLRQASVIACAGITASAAAGVFWAGFRYVAFHPSLQNLRAAWFVWCVGDATGILLLAPLGLLILAPAGKRYTNRTELITALGLLGVATAVTFSVRSTQEAYAYSFLIIAILAWMSLRFERPVSVFAVLSLAAASIWRSSHNHGPFVTAQPAGTVAVLNLYLATCSISALLFSAAAAERREAEKALKRRAEADAARRIRTAGLERQRAEFFRKVASGTSLQDSLIDFCAVIDREIAGATCVLLLLSKAALRPLIGAHGSWSLRPDIDIAASALGECMRAGQPTTLPVSADAAISYIARVAQADATQCRCSPIVTGDHVEAGFVLTFLSDDSALNGMDIDVLRTAATMAGVAINHAHLSEQLAFQAQHDSLTGLPNRILLEDRLQQAIHSAVRHTGSLAVVAIDLDGFKAVNDAEGHATGDAVLRQVADRLAGTVRKSDTVARIGGDEFVVVLNEIRNVETAVAVVEKCLRAVSQPVAAGTKPALLSCSAGICLYPEGGSTAQDLMQHADFAMYAAKRVGRATYKVFQRDMVAHNERRLELLTRLHAACANREFVLFYQPQYRGDGTLVGVEALIRWMHPAEGLLSPAHFMDVAEDTGLIVPIGSWVLREACGQLAKWHEQAQKIRMAVNVSARQFNKHDFVDEVCNVLAATGAPAKYLELELTETSVLGDLTDAALKIQELKKTGVTCVIDDFGTGHSSLRYLHELSVGGIKIDRSFVQDCGTGEQSRVIVESIVALARRLGVRVVAEGVETPGQLAILRGMGCNLIQGYLFSKPLPADACDDLLRHAAIDGSGSQCLPLPALGLDVQSPVGPDGGSLVAQGEIA